MFKFANAINLISAGYKASIFGNLVGADATSGLPDPKNQSLLQSMSGTFWWNLFWAIAGGISRFFYMIIRFILYIVDFLQFFVKHLIGIDYWQSGNVSLDTLGESDIIFKFLYDSTVQRVFRYMLGIFVVLLILFAIVAIVKNEYAFAIETKDAKNDPMSVIKSCGKAILTIVLVPIILVMGLLASNAVLAGLVNAFNVNNRLTLGGQVFTSSAYDANRYRKYAELGLRHAINNDVIVEIEENGKVFRKTINSAVIPVSPKDYGEDNPFTGFAFLLNGNYYLYYVSELELTTKVGNSNLTGYEFYVKYFKEILGVPLATYSTFLTRSVSGMPHVIKEELDHCAQSSAINKAAYNTWKYNSILKNDDVTFDKTLTYDEDDLGFQADSGNVYADAKKYLNNTTWGAIHDGGRNGLVVLPQEYMVMADVIDFMVSEASQIAIVNFYNPLIDWNYANETVDGYLSNRFVKGLSGTSKQPDSFVVNYDELGFVRYEPKNETKETQGAIYIVAYYNASTNTYVPLVNGKTYIDDYGEKHTFKSSSLENNYNGIIVARGILESNFDYHIGVPTEITTKYDAGSLNGGMDANEPYYFVSGSSNANILADKKLDIQVGFNSEWITNGLIELQDGKFYLKGKDAVDISSLNNMNIDSLKQLEKSLPSEFTYTTAVYDYLRVEGDDVVPVYHDETNLLQNISWTLCGKNDQFGFVFMANKRINATINNDQFQNKLPGETDASAKFKNYELPLYAFINIDENGRLQIQYLYSEYYESRLDWLIEGGVCTNLHIDNDSYLFGLYGGYTIKDGQTSQSNGLVARFLPIGSEISVSGNSRDHAVYIHQDSFVYPSEREFYQDNTGRIFSEPILKSSVNETDISTLDAHILKLMPKVDSSVLESVENVVVKSNVGEVVDFRNQVNGSLKYNEINHSQVVNGSNVTSFYGLYDNSDMLATFEYTANCLLQNADRIIETSAKFKSPIIVSVSYNADTQEISLYAYDVYSFRLTESGKSRDLSVGGTPYYASLYDMQFVSVESDKYTYRYKISGDYFYVDFNYQLEDGIEVFEPESVELTRVDFSFYNLFTYKDKEGVLSAYDPVKNQEADPEAITSSTIYVRKSSILTTVDREDIAGNMICIGTVYREDNDENAIQTGSIYLTYYFTIEKNSTIVGDNIDRAYRVIVGSGQYDKVPVYDSFDYFSEIMDLKSNETIYFMRQEISKHKFNIDWDLGIFGAFGGKTTRFKIGFFNGYSATNERVSSFKINGSRFDLDYNFTSSKAPSLGVDIFYVPELLNFVILIFAAGILLNILGKAVWGLIQRIFDITLYFIVLPGVVSTFPIDGGSRFSDWKGKVISKVLSAYGVLIGLNVFFILCPAIKNISHLFTDADMASLSSGNVLSGLSPAFINSVCELLFMLVALSMIQTLPNIIQQLVGTKDDIVAMGDSTKSNVKKMNEQVSKAISGKNAIDAVKKVPGTLKGFVPGSAVYDEVKSKLKKKDSGNKKSSKEIEQDLAKEQARERARRMLDEAKNKQESAGEQATAQNEVQASDISNSKHC